MDSLYSLNLAALRVRSPETARLIEGLEGPAGVTVTGAATGAPVLEIAGRALDSRRDPVRAAERSAAAVTSDPVVVAGLAGGYFIEALEARGLTVAGVIEGEPAVLAAAMRARDLTAWLSRVPVWCVSALADRVELAAIRRLGDLAVHAPSLTGHEGLAALVALWPTIRVAHRAPRVLVAGPIYGGSLETARATARAVSMTAAETKLFDFSVFAPGHHTLDALGIARSTRNRLQAGHADFLGEVLVDVALDWRADLVIALAQAPLAEAALTRLREHQVATAFWYVENHRVLPYWSQVAPHYDWFYGIQPGRFLEQLAEAGAAHPGYLPMACDPAVHQPETLTGEQRARFGSAVSFAGAPYLNRRRLLVSLADLDFRIWGDGWNEPALAHLVAGEGQRFDVRDMVRIFNATAINLNLHSAAHVADLDPDPDFVNPRTFEIAACGAFQLVDRRTPLPDLFAPDEMVVFESVPELRRLIDHYLAHPDERQAIADRARTRVLAEHTYEHRVRRILRDALPHDLAAAALHGIDAEPLDLAVRRIESASAFMTGEEACMRVLLEVEKNWGMR
ncbi:MAG: glycosyltransferase [Vicinamibacterales bacterium]|nr:glycosyltransferase [Vicinamibacterales bacterium]